MVYEIAAPLKIGSKFNNLPTMPVAAGTTNHDTAQPISAKLPGISRGWQIRIDGAQESRCILY